MTLELTLTAGIRLAYSDVFGKPGTLQMLIERLGRYSIVEIVDYLGRISAVLFNDDGRSPAVQAHLCSVLFGQRAETVWASVERWRSARVMRGHPPNVVLFDEATVALTLKLALLSRFPADPSSSTDMAALGEAMLIANKCVDSGAPRGKEPTSPSGRDAWVYYVFVVSAFQANDQPLHALARTFDLFLTDRPHLAGSASYVKLPERARQATGLDPTVLWAILFAYLAPFYAITAANAHEAYAAVHRTKYFEQYSFSDEQVREFLRLVARPAEEIATELRSSVSLNALRPYDNVAIAKSPLIEIGELALCPLLRLLFERVTTGLYHTILNATPGQDTLSVESRARFQRYMGEVFEDYIDALIRRVLEAQHRNGLPIPLYLGPNTLRALVPPLKKGQESPVCDHLIWDGASVVLWDSKAKFLPLAARVGEDREAFLTRFGDLVDGAARQLDATAQLVRRGFFAPQGIEPSRVRSIFPSMVSLAEYTVQPPLQKWIQDRTNANGLLLPAVSAPFEVLMAGDVEHLEMPWSNGRNLGSIFANKGGSSLWRNHSMHNYLAMSGDPDLSESRSPHLDRIYSELVAKTESFLKAHQSDPQDSGAP